MGRTCSLPSTYITSSITDAGIDVVGRSALLAALITCGVTGVGINVGVCAQLAAIITLFITDSVIEMGAIDGTL